VCISPKENYKLTIKYNYVHYTVSRPSSGSSTAKLLPPPQQPSEYRTLRINSTVWRHNLAEVQRARNVCTDPTIRVQWPMSRRLHLCLWRSDMQRSFVAPHSLSKFDKHFYFCSTHFLFPLWLSVHNNLLKNNTFIFLTICLEQLIFQGSFLHFATFL
jgi:hypothetical protein